MTDELVLGDAIPVSEFAKKPARATGDNPRDLLARQREAQIEAAIDLALGNPEQVIPVQLGALKLATFRIRLGAVLEHSKKAVHVVVRDKTAYFSVAKIPGSRERKPKK
jgi:hypothetical protein